MNRFIFTSTDRKIKILLIFCVLQIATGIYPDIAKAQVWQHQPQLNFDFDKFLPVGRDTFYTVSKGYLKFSYDTGYHWDSAFIHPSLSAEGFERTSDGTLWVWGVDNQTFGVHVLLRSTNNGDTWKTIIDYNDTLAAFGYVWTLSCHFTDSLNGYAFVNDTLYTTSDGGNAFQNRNLVTQPIDFRFTDTHWMVFGSDGTNNMLYTSPDSGQHWHAEILQHGTANPYDPIQMIDSNTVYYAQSFYIFKYNFADSSWDTLNITHPFNQLFDFMRISEDTLIVLDSGRVYRSYDGGQSFKQEQVDKFVPYLINIHRQGNTYYLTGYSELFRFNPTANSVGMSDISEIPEKLRVWPNPSAGIINIEFPIEGYEIYDRFGRMMERSNESSAGSISIEHLPAGIYYFRIFTQSGGDVIPVVKIN